MFWFYCKAVFLSISFAIAKQKSKIKWNKVEHHEWDSEKGNDLDYFFRILLWFLSNLKKKNPSRDCENQTERQAALEGDNEAVNSVCIAHKIQMLEVLTCRMWQNLLWSGDLYFVLVAIPGVWCLELIVLNVYALKGQSFLSDSSMKSSVSLLTTTTIESCINRIRTT